jgi:hydrogenase expression/formation protein HypC
MCLAVPGKIIKIADTQSDPLLGRLATVDFQGSTVEVSLSLTPDAAEGDWVLVHAGYAINRLEEEEAQEVWEYLRELEISAPGEPEEA